ncbi:hypothetical protein EI94DRAFT_1695784 [Lactarius quietus]|nr:hypothetical protein EI94DRAFT_1695784 [Lactarius quietus]
MSSFLSPDSTDGGLDMPRVGDQPSQAYDGLWQFGLMGADTDFQQGSLGAASIGVGSHSPNIQSIITNASEKALEQNVFYVCVKWTAGQQKIKIMKLHEIVACQTKELEELRLLNNSNQETIKLFAKEYNDMKGDGMSLSLALRNALLKPNLRN